MQVSNLRRSLLLQIAIILGASGTRAQQKVLWQAEVIPERLNVYVQVSIQHEVTMQLNRGAIVNVVLEIAVLGDQWCRIALPDHSEPEGYTLCAGLKPVSPAERQNSRVEPVVLRRQQTVSASIAIPTPPTAATKPGMLSNKDITDMVASGLPEAVVVAKIKSTGCEFDTAPATLKALKTNGLPDSVILAMVEAPAGQPKVTKVAEVPVTTASVDRQTTSSDGKIRVLVTDSQSWEMRGGSSAGGNSNGWGASSSFSGGARPQTAEIIKTLNERCPEVTVTNRLDKADFVLTLDHEGGKGLVRRRNKIAVFNKDGDDIMSRSTRSLGNSVKDACEAILAAKT